MLLQVKPGVLPGHVAVVILYTVPYFWNAYCTVTPLEEVL